jgi:hypothetical protein
LYLLSNECRTNVAPKNIPPNKFGLLDRINDTLDYPPRGSPEAGNEDLEAAAGAERLSAESPSGEQSPEEPDEQEENGGRRTER